MDASWYSHNTGHYCCLIKIKQREVNLGNKTFLFSYLLITPRGSLVGALMLTLM